MCPSRRERWCGWRIDWRAEIPPLKGHPIFEDLTVSPSHALPFFRVAIHLGYFAKRVVMQIISRGLANLKRVVVHFCTTTRSVSCHAISLSRDLGRDGKVDLNSHRLGWIGELDDVDFSGVTARR